MCELFFSLSLPFSVYKEDVMPFMVVATSGLREINQIEVLENLHGIVFD